MLQPKQELVQQNYFQSMKIALQPTARMNLTFVHPKLAPHLLLALSLHQYHLVDQSFDNPLKTAQHYVQFL